MLHFDQFICEPRHAQHGDYLLGTNGLLSGAQPSEGFLGSS
jgi:hypothetical protein